jgi:photosystem II stability/assembly factor-like uncharacterized protein
MRSLFCRARLSGSATLLVACVMVIAAPASAERVSAGWSWTNPAPLGRVARGVVVAGAYVYAIGDGGSLIRSRDVGVSWSPLDTGSDDPVGRIEVIDESTLITADPEGCDLRKSIDAGRTFAAIFNSPPRCTPVAAFSFVSPSIGFLLLRSGAVERTIDGGNSFTPVAAIPGTPAAIGINDEKRFASSEGLGVEVHFRTSTAGIAFVTPSAGPSAAYTTNDGGASWSPVALPPSAQVEQVDIVNDQIAYAAGTGTLLYSGDGGATWQALPNPLDQSPEAVFCTATSGCLAKARLTRKMIALQGGAAPSAVAPSFPLCAAGDRLPSQIVTSGREASSENASLLLGEATGGCAPQSARAEIEYGDLLQGPGKLAYAVGTNGHLALSDDEGLSWKVLSSGSSAPLTDAAFDSGYGLTLDRKGVVRETDDGGVSWRTLQTGTRGTPRAVAIAGRSVLALGSRGIRRSYNGGKFVSVGGRAGGKAHLFAFDEVGPVVLAYGERVLLRSTDAGLHWQSLRLPANRPEDVGIGDVSFVSRTRGYLLDRASTLWITADGARHWRQMPSAGPGGASRVRFANAKDGYLSGLLNPFPEHDAYVLHTTDGGATWSPEFVGTGWVASQVVARGADAAVLLQEPTADDSGTMFFATTSSGAAGAVPAHIGLEASKRSVSGHELLAGHGVSPVTVSGTLSTAEPSRPAPADGSRRSGRSGAPRCSSPCGSASQVRPARDRELSRSRHLRDDRTTPTLDGERAAAGGWLLCHAARRSDGLRDRERRGVIDRRPRPAGAWRPLPSQLRVGRVEAGVLLRKRRTSGI